MYASTALRSRLLRATGADSRRHRSAPSLPSPTAAASIAAAAKPSARAPRPSTASRRWCNPDSMNFPLAPEHKVFEKDVGLWDAEIEVRPGPGAPVQRSRGVSENRLTCGGAWLVTDYRADSGF